MLAGVQTDITSIEINVLALQQAGNRSTSIFSYTTFDSIYPKDPTYYYRDTCSSMFTAALFIIVRDRKQPRCPSKGEWLMRM